MCVPFWTIELRYRAGQEEGTTMDTILCIDVAGL